VIDRASPLGHLAAKRRASLFVAACLLAGLALAGCEGEDRPQVDIIGGGNSASVSASSAEGPFSGGPSASSGVYKPVSYVDSYLQAGLDLRDMRVLMTPATPGQPIDWAAVATVYANGKNQQRADGTTRSLASLSTDGVLDVFPNGSAVYGRSGFIDGLIRDGLSGSGRASGLSDSERAQIVDKGVQMLMYAKSLEELEIARSRIAARNLDNATGAPHSVDEAWGVIAGWPDESGGRPHGLIAAANAREVAFNFEGRLTSGLEAAYATALTAAQRGDAAAFDTAAAEIKGRLNTIFYLGTLRHLKQLPNITDTEVRRLQLVESWANWQTLRAAVALVAPASATAVEAALSRASAEPFPVAATMDVYAALNQTAVVQALGIPANLVVSP